MAKIAVIGLSGASIFLNVETLPKEGMTIHAQQLHIEPGGKGYNQAAACAKMGVEVSYLSKVGNDKNGKDCIDYLRHLGITDYFVKDLENNTALATILTDQKGENEVIVYPGASTHLCVKDVTIFDEEIKKADCLLVQYELPMEVIKEAMAIAKKAGTLIILNPAPAIYQDFTLLEMADIVCPNLNEARSLYQIPSNISNGEIGCYLQDKIKNRVIVTMGKNGCLYVEKGKHQYFSSIQVEAVDTTGAGDVFNAGIATALANQKSIEETIQFAIVASGLSVTKKYVMDAIPTVEDIERYRKQNDNQ